MKSIIVVALIFYSTLCLGETHGGFDPAELVAGETVFVENCAVCHGSKAQGLTSDWRQPDADGKYPPPPLNGTAHAWHHTAPSLFKTIYSGTIHIGGSMPAMGEKLSEMEIYLVLNWITSLWPEEIYSNWRAMHNQ